MSDDGKKPERFLDKFNAPLEQALHHLRERGLDHAPCPICRNPDWVTETRTDPEDDQIDHNAAVFLLKDPTIWGSRPSIPALVLTCTSCGFVRMHNVSWLTTRSEAEAGNE